MTDDLTRYEPCAVMVDKTRGSGVRWIGQMREEYTGKWVHLDEVALLRMQAESLRQELATAEAVITDLIGSTDMPWAEAVGRAEAFLYAKTERKPAND